MRKKLTVAFIIIGLIGIAASSLWIYDHWEKARQYKVGAAAAESVISGWVAIPPDLSHVIIASHVISHRGYPYKAEEFTMKGYDLAVEAGSLYLEQDLVMSDDGTMYISHDLTATRMTGKSKYYSEMSDKKIDKLRTHGGEKILRLTDVFDKYGKSVFYVTELKDTDVNTVNVFADVIRRYGMERNMIIQSIDPAALEEMERIFPAIPKMLVCRDQSELNYGLGLDYVDIISVRKDYMGENNLKAVHESGKKFSAWTLDSEYEILRAIELGVDIYFTDDTALAISLEKENRKL